MTLLAWKKRSQVLTRSQWKSIASGMGTCQIMMESSYQVGCRGAANLRDNSELIAALQEESRKGKIISAICAAPIVLARAGLLKDKHYTCYDGFEEEIQDGHYQKETVVKDGNLLTSRGPSTALALAYALVEQFGGDAQSLRQGMLYQDVFGDA